MSLRPARWGHGPLIVPYWEWQGSGTEPPTEQSCSNLSPGGVCGDLMRQL